VLLVDFRAVLKANRSRVVLHRVHELREKQRGHAAVEHRLLDEAGGRAAELDAVTKGKLSQHRAERCGCRGARITATDALDLRLCE
jgi:hypothetical protein